MSETALPRFVKIPYRHRRGRVLGGALARRLERDAKAIHLDDEAKAWEGTNGDEGMPTARGTTTRRRRGRLLVAHLERTESTLDPRYRMGVVRITERF